MIFYSSIEPIYFSLPVLGLIVGLFGTILGGGGGFFFLPILMLGLKLPAQTAVITSLVATLPICIVGSWGHYRLGNINFKAGAVFAFVGVAGALLGASITSIISTKQLQIGFGVYSVLIALNMAYVTWQQKLEETRSSEKQKVNSSIAKYSKSSFFGFTAGLITGVFGTSGSAPILAGLFSIRMPLRMVIGTSLMVVLVNSLFAVGAHFMVSNVDMTLVSFLTAGSIAGALAGTRLLAKMKIEKSESSVKYVYAAVIVVMGIIMIKG